MTANRGNPANRPFWAYRIARMAWYSPTITSWSSFSITALNFLLLLPLAVQMLPGSEFSLWMIFGALGNMQSILTFGMAPTFTRLVAYALAGREVDEMGAEADTKAVSTSTVNSESLRRIAGTTHLVFGALAMAALLIGASVGTWLLRRPVGFVSSPASVWMAWTIFLLGNFLAIVGTGVGVILMGLNQVALVQRWQTLFGLGNVFTSALVLTSGGGFLALVATGQLFGCLAVARNIWICRQVDGGREAIQIRSGFDRKVWRVAWPASWRSGVANFVYYGYVQVSGLIYAQFGNPISVASYLFTLRLVQAVSSFSQAPFYSRIPRLAFLRASRQQKEMLECARRGMRLSYWVYATGIMALVLLAEPALRLVGKGQYHIQPSLLLLLAVGIFFERVAGMNLQLVALSNRIYGHIGCVGASVVNLAVCAAFVAPMGANAFALGLLCGQMGFQFWYAIKKAEETYGAEMWRLNREIAVLPFGLVLLVVAGQTLWHPAWR